MAAITAATVSTTGRQPPASAMAASAGSSSSVPVAVLAVSRPITKPRLVTNQRLTMVAPSTMATQPEPRPDSTPQDSMNCQGSLMRLLAAVEADINSSAVTSVRLMPKLCIRAAANGPTRP
jgi:acyl-CoA hydrolase